MNPNFYPVILAGGRGTRFWPRSRRTTAKQVLALEGKKTMIQQTIARLLPLAPASRFWIITNPDLRNEIRRQLPKISARQIIAEPAARNTAPAIGLAAYILLRSDPTAVIGMFPADHVIADEKAFRKAVERAAAIAAAGENMVRLGSTGAYQLIAHVLGEGNVNQAIRMDMADLSSAQGVFRASKPMRVGGDP